MTPDEIIDNNTDKIPQLDGPSEAPKDTPVKLELDDDGYIVGPNIPKNASPPAKVFHPITKPPLLQRSRLTGGGSPNLVGLVERKAL